MFCVAFPFFVRIVTFFKTFKKCFVLHFLFCVQTVHFFKTRLLASYRLAMATVDVGPHDFVGSMQLEFQHEISSDEVLPAHLVPSHSKIIALLPQVGTALSSRMYKSSDNSLREELCELSTRCLKHGASSELEADQASPLLVFIAASR